MKNVEADHALRNTIHSATISASAPSAIQGQISSVPRGSRPADDHDASTMGAETGGRSRRAGDGRYAVCDLRLRCVLELAQKAAGMDAVRESLPHDVTAGLR